MTMQDHFHEEEEVPGMFFEGHIKNELGEIIVRLEDYTDPSDLASDLMWLAPKEWQVDWEMTIWMVDQS